MEEVNKLREVEFLNFKKGLQILRPFYPLPRRTCYELLSNVRMYL